MSAIERFLKGNVQSGPENDVRYREVSVIKCLLYRGSLKCKLIEINPFSGKVSVIERCLLYRDFDHFCPKVDFQSI